MTDQQTLPMTDQGTQPMTPPPDDWPDDIEGPLFPSALAREDEEPPDSDPQPPATPPLTAEEEAEQALAEALRHPVYGYDVDKDRMARKLLIHLRQKGLTLDRDRAARDALSVERLREALYRRLLEVDFAAYAKLNYQPGEMQNVIGALVIERAFEDAALPAADALDAERATAKRLREALRKAVETLEPVTGKFEGGQPFDTGLISKAVVLDLIAWAALEVPDARK